MNVKKLAGKVAAEFRRFQRRRRAAATLKAIRAEIAGSLRTAPRIGLAISGGMGDFIVIARYLRDLLAHVGPVEVDIFASNAGIAEWVFRDVPGVRGIYDGFYIWKRVKQDYSAAFNVQQVVIVHRHPTHFAALLRQNPAWQEVCDRIDDFVSRHQASVDNHPLMDNLLARAMVEAGFARRDALQGLSGIVYGGDRLPLRVDPAIFERTGLIPGGYITVSNGFDANFDGGIPTSTKVYPHYTALVARIKASFPHLPVVQLGVQTSQPIPGIDVQLLNATTLREAAAVIGGSMLHIDNEGGLVHLAAALGVRSCVLFGPTSLAYYAYPGNLNIAPGACGDCWWMKRDWMSRCVRGMDVPECLDTVRPDDVFRAIEPYLGPGRDVSNGAGPGHHGEAA